MTKVFIASRFAEFNKLRAALNNHHNHDQIEYVALDDGQPDSVSPLDRSLRELEDADLMVLFLGETIGPQVADSQEALRSIVEHEWELAQGSEIPCLVWFTQQLHEQLSATEPKIDERLQQFANRILQSKVTVGTLFGEDSLSVAQRIEIELFGSVLARRRSSASGANEIRHDGQFVQEVKQQSDLYGIPLTSEGPEYAKKYLLAREGALDSLERRLPVDAIDLLEKIDDLETCKDVATLWLLGEMYCRYSNEIEVRRFLQFAPVLAARLYEIRDSLPIGLRPETDKTLKIRGSAVTCLVARLLLAIEDSRRVSEERDGHADLRELMTRVLAEIRHAQTPGEQNEVESRITLRLESLVGTPASLTEQFVKMWRWRPNLAISSLRLLPVESSWVLVQKVIEEAQHDFQGIFEKENFTEALKLRKEPSSCLAAFRGRMRSRVDTELGEISESFMKMDSHAPARANALAKACRFPTLYVRKYRPGASSRLGDVVRRQIGDEGKWFLAVVVPAECDFGRVPLHAFSSRLEPLWKLVKAHIEDQQFRWVLDSRDLQKIKDLWFGSLFGSSPESNVETFEEIPFDVLWNKICKETCPELIELELSARVLAQKFINSYHAVFHEVRTVLHELQYGSAVDSARRKLYREANLDSDVMVGLWLKGVTLSEILAAIRDLEPARLKTWAEHDAVWDVRERHPGPEDPRELEMTASAEAYFGAMERLRVARRESGIESERPLSFNDERCERQLREMTDRRQALEQRELNAAARELVEQEQARRDEIAEAENVKARQIAEAENAKARQIAQVEEELTRSNAAFSAKVCWFLFVLQLLSLPLQLILMIRGFGWSVLWFSASQLAGWTFWVIFPIVNLLTFGILLATAEDYESKAKPGPIKSKTKLKTDPRKPRDPWY